ncbi:unnamed protein product [Ectocarpus sp. 4 AP-2014]
MAARRGSTRRFSSSSFLLLMLLVIICAVGWPGCAEGFGLLPPVTDLLLQPRTATRTRTSLRQRQQQLGRRRSSIGVSMTGEETSCNRAGFLKNGLALLVGSVAVASSSPAVAEMDSDELDEETKQKITQALMEALEGMEGMELTPGGGAQSKDVLKASSDVLPNRSPFEMQYELFKRGMELEDDDDFVGAERQWTEIIENFNSPNFRATSPGNKVLLARAYSNRGNTRLSLQKTREAILDYSESIDLVPEKGEFWLARGVAFEDMADRKVLARADRNVEVARTFYESALADYDHAVVLDPQVEPASRACGHVRLSKVFSSCSPPPVVCIHDSFIHGTRVISVRVLFDNSRLDRTWTAISSLSRSSSLAALGSTIGCARKIISDTFFDEIRARASLTHRDIERLPGPAAQVHTNTLNSCLCPVSRPFHPASRSQSSRFLFVRCNCVPISRAERLLSQNAPNTAGPPCVHQSRRREHPPGPGTRCARQLHPRSQPKPHDPRVSSEGGAGGASGGAQAEGRAPHRAAVASLPELPGNAAGGRFGGLGRRRVGGEPGDVRRSDSLGPAPHGRELHLAHPPLAGAAAQHGESAPLGLQRSEGERPRSPGA